jgi:hypothetical protein
VTIRPPRSFPLAELALRMTALFLLSGLPLGPRDVLLVTGGGKGIAADARERGKSRS